MRKKLTLDDYVQGIKNKDRTLLARAISLIESTNPIHQKTAQDLLTQIIPLTGFSKRIGISGTPGVGKSTFIEAFGKMLTAQKKTVAVLAIDPTSQVSGGSILGDKTRMHELATDPLAFIRPSPAGETLGGVAKKTRETLLLCEAFGFDYVLIETVGVGQSETTVSEMVDIFIMLLQPGSGDDLQGIKRGILELVDMVIVTKDDGDQSPLIEKAKHDYKQALEVLRHGEFTPKVLSCSALHKTGLEQIQIEIDQYFHLYQSKITNIRFHQGLDWMWQLVRENLEQSFRHFVGEIKLKEIEKEVLEKRMTSLSAAENLIQEYYKKISTSKE
jgi:LAO/AO transport system kinase